MTRPDICPTCAPTRTGTCARLRCYCGHEACWAFASWVPTGLGDVVSFEVAGRERVAGNSVGGERDSTPAGMSISTHKRYNLEKGRPRIALTNPGPGPSEVAKTHGRTYIE